MSFRQSAAISIDLFSSPESPKKNFLDRLKAFCQFSVAINSLILDIFIYFSKAIIPIVFLIGERLNIFLFVRFTIPTTTEYQPMAKAVMNGNLTGNGFDKNPQNINRKGRPAMLFKDLINELEKEGYGRVSQAELVKAIETLLAMPVWRVNEIAGNPKNPDDDKNDLPTAIRVPASELLGKRKIEMFKEMLDRAHGKATQNHNHAGSIQAEIATHFYMPDGVNRVKKDE